MRYDSDRPLTTKQRVVLTSIVMLTERDGHPPTVRELAEHVGVHSTSTVNAHLQNLRARKLVTWKRSQPRTLRVIDAGAV